MTKEETEFLRAVTHTLLYYGRAVDNTILTTLSAIATEQAKPMEKMTAKVKQLLDYCATQDKPVITYNARKMILTGYCNENNSPGGHFFLPNGDNDSPNNGAILTIATIIKAVMLSAAKAELGALYLNPKESVYL